MHRWGKGFFCLFVTAVLLISSGCAFASIPEGAEYVPGEALVMFKTGASSSSASLAAASVNASDHRVFAALSRTVGKQVMLVRSPGTATE